MNTTLEAFGWTPELADASAGRGEGQRPARVVLTQRGIFRLQGEDEAFDAVLSGRLRHLAEASEQRPAVGDWVLYSRPDAAGMGLIDDLLPRQSKLSRKVAGERAVEQVLAANVDRILVVMGLDGDYNLRRLERYLVMTRESGARPVVVLSKADLCDDVSERRAGAASVADGAPVLVVSALTGDLEPLREELRPGETLALVGSSGAGKSTLINHLAGEDLLRTGAVRQNDDRGMHTTTHRELFLLPEGYLLIDNPGLRELQLWSAEDGLDEAFDDIRALAAGCRFRDCAHGDEPGCAVQAAIRDGRLARERWRNFEGLQREAAALAARRDVRAKRAADKRLGQLYKRIQQQNRKNKGS